MKKVLLAVEGMLPDQHVLNYAARLCRRIRAELNILHIIDPGIHADCLKDLNRKAHLARNVFENAMMAAAFAETGEFDTARSISDKADAQVRQMLSDEDKSGIRYRVRVKPGEPEREIPEYVQKNRGIVLAIYDDAAAEQRRHAGESPGDGAGEPGTRDRPVRRRRLKASALQKKLQVPLVIRSSAA